MALEKECKELADEDLMLPVYLWNRKTKGMARINEKITRYELISAFQEDPLPWIAHSKQPLPNVWFAVPQWWWFKRVDVELFEKLQQPKIATGSSIINKRGSQSNLRLAFPIGNQDPLAGRLNRQTQKIDRR